MTPLLPQPFDLEERCKGRPAGSDGALAFTICDAVENSERPAAVRAAH